MAYQFPSAISAKNRAKVARMSAIFLVVSFLVPVLIILLR